MQVELINTGSELMLGSILNTHQRWICRRLADEGVPVARQVAIPDDAQSICAAIAEALQRADLVIMTGGLGPTSDDLTRDLVAEMLGCGLVEDIAVRQNIERFFAIRGRSMPQRVLVQALVPEGAIVLPNHHGTAPGLVMQVPAGRLSPRGGLLILLPGPPRELQPMFDQQVLPLLRERNPERGQFCCITFRSTGLGESWVEDQLRPLLPPLLERGVRIGYCAATGQVDVRVVAEGAVGPALIQEAERMIRGCLGAAIYGTGDDLLETIVVRELKQRAARVAVAESCTGGLLAHRITNVPGASEIFWGGWITYDNAAKEGELGVSSDILRQDGAVSEPCAAAMAMGAMERSGAAHALSITGIAGPSGGTEQKPVGTVFVGLASRGHPLLVRRFFNPFDRETFKYVTTQQALDLLRQRLLGQVQDDERTL